MAPALAGELQPGASCCCRLVAGGVVRPARVVVVETGLRQAVVAAPASCAIGADGRWLLPEATPRGPQVFRCGTSRPGVSCGVVFYSVDREALVPQLPGAVEFQASDGRAALPSKGGLVSLFYGSAREQTERVRTAGESCDAGSCYYTVKVAEPSDSFVQNSVLLIPDFLTVEECRMLMAATDEAVTEERRDPLERFPVCGLAQPAQDLSASILEDRLLPFFEQHLPGMAQELFGRTTGLKGLGFSYSPNEPAVNRYTVGGEFKVHCDAYSVTVNVLLSEPDAFVGGGTAFWPQADADGECAADEEMLHLKPRRGTAVVFNGDILHAGRPVEEGIRHLYVASFNLS